MTSALVLLGIGLQTAAFLGGRDLWIDEAMLALNLVERTPARLFEPLDRNQAAPVGFLLAVKVALGTFGPHPAALRLVPFLGSVLGLIGFAVLSRRLLPPPTAALAVGLLAVGPHQVSYAAECKPYATDWAVTVGLVLVLSGLWDDRRGRLRWAGLAVVGAAAVWCSYPAVFVLGGIGTALFLEAVVRRDRRRVAAVALVCACWLGNFAACHLLVLKPIATNAYLTDYWHDHFWPLPPRSPGDLVWLADHFFALFVNPGGFGGGSWQTAGVAAVLFAVGGVAWVRDRHPLTVVLGVTAGLTLIASALQKYPFAGRLLLFLVPLVVLGVASGAGVVLSALWSRQRFAAQALLAVLLAAPTLETVQNLRKPPRREQLGELLGDLRRQVRPGDVVYLHWGAEPAFTFYTRHEPFPVPVVVGGIHSERPAGYRDELRRLAGRPRVWVVFSHPHGAEESLLRAYAEGLGEPRGTLRRPGATATCYDFRQPG